MGWWHYELHNVVLLLACTHSQHRQVGPPATILLLDHRDTTRRDDVHHLGTSEAGHDDGEHGLRSASADTFRVHSQGGGQCDQNLAAAKRSKLEDQTARPGIRAIGSGQCIFQSSRGFTGRTACAFGGRKGGDAEVALRIEVTCIIIKHRLKLPSPEVRKAVSMRRRTSDKALQAAGTGRRPGCAIPPPVRTSSTPIIMKAV